MAGAGHGEELLARRLDAVEPGAGDGRRGQHQQDRQLQPCALAYQVQPPQHAVALEADELQEGEVLAGLVGRRVLRAGVVRRGFPGWAGVRALRLVAAQDAVQLAEAAAVLAGDGQPLGDAVEGDEGLLADGSCRGLLLAGRGQWLGRVARELREQGAPISRREFKTRARERA